MASGKRIYVVTQGDDTFLVNAANKSAAINAAARKTISAHVASQLELVEMIGSGAKIIEAGEASE